MENIFMEIFASLGGLFVYIIKAFLPLFFGLSFAYLFNGPVEWMSLKLSNNSTHVTIESPKGRGLAILITYLCAAIIIILIILAFITLMLGAFPSGGLSSVTNRIYEYFDSYYQSIQIHVSNYLPESFAGGTLNLKSIIVSWLEKHFSFDKLIGLFSSIASGLINVALGIVVSIYILKDKELFSGLFQKFLSVVLPQKIHGLVNEILSEINIVLSTFIKGAFIDSILVSLISSVVLSLLNIKFSVIIGIIGGLLNIIPYFGPFLGAIPAFLMALTLQGPVKALSAVVALFIVQQLDSNYIYPKIVGSSTGLHPLFILISVSAMGYFAGIIGMLFAVPLASILHILIKKWAYSL